MGTGKNEDEWDGKADIGKAQSSEQMTCRSFVTELQKKSKQLLVTANIFQEQLVRAAKN